MKILQNLTFRNLENMKQKMLKVEAFRGKNVKSFYNDRPPFVKHLLDVPMYTILTSVFVAIKH